MITQEWNPEEVLRNTLVEGEFDERSERQRAFAKLNDNVVMAALSVIHIALHGQNEAKRLEASRYIIDRVMGKPPSHSEMSQKDDRFAKLFEQLIDSETEEAA